MVWSLVSTNGTQVVLNLLDPPGVLSLNGIPQFVRSSDGHKPTAATLTGTQLTITFSPAEFGPYQLTLGPLDPALRSNTGAYLAPGEQSVVFPTFPTFLFTTEGGGAGAQVNVPGDVNVVNNDMPDGIEGQLKVIAAPNDQVSTLTITGTGGSWGVTPSEIAHFKWSGGAWAKL